MLSVRKNEYPSKQTVNLVFRERSINSPSRAIPAFLLFLVFLALFVRFGVQGQLQKMTSAQALLEKVQADLNGLVEYNRDYETVREQYSQYFNDYLNEDEAVLRDRLDVLTLLEECVMNQADLSSISVQGNICRISITDVPLNTISGIVADLERNPQVQYISVATAATENNEEGQDRQNVTANVTITLTGGQDR
ncbi:hypothetical protein [Enterocloster asparagiformis]|uniref:Uncharacterized protein n=2 Tax=Enterocloster asparagiformis TaxID=333367 RepID=C0D962_9FIRM|nr:hypothetical protein [Enterocloster asparagiformis]EEG52133.1 hypothetical protein CLOSTASPAR_05811 [[Clostridium] asparagiforme DSM 15981]RGX31459.1 hypothetical protein DWV29_06160 [Enterocloster asparagiformis]UWO74504.1 hypothetical protein NQ535_16815 [[Clostridium] asparagiforme DSM 15981]